MNTLLHLMRRFVRIAHNVSYLYLANTIASISGFFVVLILANSLEQSDYGYYKYVFSLAGSLSVLSFTGGFRNTTLQSVAQGHDGIVSYLFPRMFTLSVPMIIGAGAISLWYLNAGNSVIGYSILIVSLMSILGNAGVIAYGYWNGRKLYRTLFWLQTLQGAFLIALIGATLLFTHAVGIIIAISAATSGLTFLAFYLYTRTHVRNTEVSPRMTRFGTHLSIMSMISTVMINIDSLLIFKFIGAEALALYALATPFVDRLIGFLKATYYYALPGFTERGPQAAYQSLYKRSFVVLGFGIIMYAAYYALAPLFFEFFFPKYLASVELSRLFALTIPVIAFSILFDAFLDSLIEARRKYVVKLSTTGIRLLTLFLFIPPFGVIGVIWSEIVARMLGTLITIALIEHKMRGLTPQTSHTK